MRIYIAEDEPLAAAKLKLFLEKAGVDGDITIFDDGQKLQTALSQSGAPDVIFLDIQMPNLTGLQFLEAYTAGKDFDSPRPDIIITSAYDQYAIDGFNYGVTDYLLKPYTLERLKQSLAKLHVANSARTDNNVPATTVYEAQSINLRSEGRTERVLLPSIECIEAVKDYMVFILDDGRRIKTLGTLGNFEQQLPSSHFQRVQRSYIVNLHHVKSFGSQTVTLTSGLEIPLGKTYKETFERAINTLTV